jgi:hypothetical protein
MVPRLLSLALILVLAACSRSSTGPTQELMARDVGGVYHICALTFNPSGAIIPAVDIRAATMRLDADAPTPPRLFVGQTVQEFELEYTRQDDVLRDRAQGWYTITGRTVQLDLEGGQSGQTVRNRLVLPARLNLDFQATPQRLTISEQLHGDHLVTRSDYERLWGETDPNLPDTIRGTLRGDFSTAGCS